MDEQIIELHRSELATIQKIMLEIQRKYASRPATAVNLSDMRKECHERALKEAGIEVALDTTGLLRNPPRPISIAFVGRTTPFDPEREQWEAQHGIGEEALEWEKEQLEAERLITEAQMDAVEVADPEQEQ